MASEHLLIPNRQFSFGMLITRLLKQLKFDLSTERSIEPSIDINSALLKRMRARERVLAPQPPPIFLLLSLDHLQPLLIHTQLSTQLREHDLKMTANFQRMEHRVDNDLRNIRASIRYLQTCVDKTYSRNAWPVPLPRGHSQPLPTSGPPFNTWITPPAPSEAPAPPEDPDFQED